MALRIVFVLMATFLLVIPGMMTRGTSNSQLKNSSMDMDTQNEIKHEFKENSTFINQTKAGFVPSFQLGTVETFIEPSNNKRDKGLKSPFNAEPQKIRFGDRTNLPFNSLRTIKFDNMHGYNKSENQIFPSSKKENIVKFMYDTKDYQEEERFNGPNIIKLNNRYSQLPSRFEHSEYPDGQSQVPEVNYIEENYGTEPQYLNYETKPTKFHDPTIYRIPHQQLALPGDNHYLPLGQSGTFQTDEKYIKPDTIINVHPMSYQATSFDMHSKPKTVVYVTSHEQKVTKKIPYQYYQSTVFDHNVEPVVIPEITTEQSQYPVLYEQKNKSIIPWKKIFHLIGAFLPLGLLFAFLSPKVISADHNADPNIALSKLRINDLPAEHKQSRFLYDIDSQQECTERLICRLMAAANPANSNFLRHLLMHATARTPESAVRKKELERIFEAAKLGNCDILTCNFYDGT